MWPRKSNTLAICFLLKTLISCGHGTMLELVEELKKDGFIKSECVLQTMLAVDRKKFCEAPEPYIDVSRPIGFGATISAPNMHASTLELMKDRLVPGGTALDIGSGSGYITVCMAMILGEKGFVVGVEHVAELADAAVANTKKQHDWLLTSGRIKYVIGDGRRGYESSDNIRAAAHWAAAGVPLYAGTLIKDTLHL